MQFLLSVYPVAELREQQSSYLKKHILSIFILCVLLHFQIPENCGQVPSVGSGEE